MLGLEMWGHHLCDRGFGTGVLGEVAGTGPGLHKVRCHRLQRGFKGIAAERSDLLRREQRK